MAIRRKYSNISDTIIEEPLKSILCEYYLWVRWCNIGEINGYYIYDGMKGNKLSFVHQQNSKLIIYFHTFSSDKMVLTDQYSFFSSLHKSSIPENHEQDDNEIKFNLSLESPSSSSSMRHDQSSPKFSNNTNNSNNSTPCSSPPQSPRNGGNITKKTNPRLTPGNSIDEYLYNHWVIKYENDILYFTKDKEDSIDNEYPPSYGWKYNEKNQSSLTKSYLENAYNPIGITRIPIIPEPMIINNNNNNNNNNGVYAHGSFKNGNGVYPQNNGNDKEIAIPIPSPFDLP